MVIRFLFIILLGEFKSQMQPFNGANINKILILEK